MGVRAQAQPLAGRSYPNSGSRTPEPALLMRLRGGAAAVAPPLPTDGGEPVQRAEDADAPPTYRGSVVFYAVVSDEIEQVIEFFRTPAEAEAMLETVLEDEPGWREILYVEPVELVTGCEN
jgi:hypothetical protein